MSLFKRQNLDYQMCFLRGYVHRPQEPLLGKGQCLWSSRIVQFCLKFWAAITEDTVEDPCLLPYRLTAQRNRNFLKTIQPVLLKILPVSQNSWFQYHWAPARYRQDFGSRRTRHIQEGGVDVGGQMRDLLSRRT